MAIITDHGVTVEMSDGERLQRVVELLQETREVSTQAKAQMERLRFSETRREEKNLASDILFMVEDFCHPLSLAIQKFERVEEPVEVKLHEVNRETDILRRSYPEWVEDNEGIDIRLRDLKGEFRREVEQPVKDIKEGLASSEDLDETDFFDAERSPRTGHQILCIMHEGLKDHL